VVFIVETQVIPMLVVVNGAEGAVSARAACAARRARSMARRVATGDGTAARAAVGAFRSVAGSGERDSTRGARTREPDDHVLHCVKRELVTVVNVGEKLFVGLLVARGFREVEAHESDEGVDVRYCHGLHVAELRSRGVDGGNVVGVAAAVESSLKPRHVLRPRERSLCAMEAPVTGYRRKASICGTLQVNPPPVPDDLRTALAPPTTFGTKLFEVTALLAVATACKLNVKDAGDILFLRD
jgi:hypothetical protein